MTDLQALRAWRTAGRALVLNGFEGSQGVALLEFRSGVRYRADYESPASAAVAVKSGAVRWRAVARVHDASGLRRRLKSSKI